MFHMKSKLRQRAFRKAQKEQARRKGAKVAHLNSQGIDSEEEMEEIVSAGPDYEDASDDEILSKEVHEQL